MTTDLPNSTDEASSAPTIAAPAPAPAPAPAAPAALAAQLPATTIGEVLARMIPNPPTEAELADLLAAAEAARTESAEADDRRQRLRAEIEAARTATQPRPDLIEVVAALTAGAIEASVRGIPLPADHAQRIAEARAAIAAAEAQRAESELLLPVLEKLLVDVDSEARRARDRSNRASATYGTAQSMRLAATRYLPAIATALEAEAEIEQVIDRWGANVLLEVEFRSPAGDKWTRRIVEHEIQRAAEREAVRSQSAGRKAAA